VGKYAGKYSKVKSVENDGFEDVYCLAVPETGNFVANGMVIKNCDALRYICATHKVSTYQPYKHNPNSYIRERFKPSR
jgi:hypothetical protein